MNFAVILLLASIALGIPWLLDIFVLKPARKKKADLAVAQFDAQPPPQSAVPVDQATMQRQRDQIRADLERQPIWMEYTGGFFPVIVAVFVFRSFLFEPFKIPTGSMIPTLLVDDLILVNKFTYGVRLPVIHTKILNLNQPKTGDVMVFRYPPDPSLDYIKRVIGVPGDVIEFENQRVTLNGKLLPLTAQPEFLDVAKLVSFPQHLESLGNIDHKVLTDLNKKFQMPSWDGVPLKENCRINTEKMSCKVPAGHYFMMGDNRDNSADSRFWGFVPEENIVGKAFFIWMHFGDFKRIGSFQ